MTARDPLLTVRRLSKTFPGLRALDEIDLDIGSGEIVAVVGQNGSGKSTLVKILAGVYAADAGCTVEARTELRFIHQDLGLVGGLSTVENLGLGGRHRGAALRPTRPREERLRAEELLRRLDASFDVTVPVGELAASERTIVAIARAFDGWRSPNQVLVLDEPTAALRGEAAGRLFAAVRRIAAEGAGVLFISHHLDEVTELADRVVALRDGRKVADLPAARCGQDALVQLIVGDALEQAHYAARPLGEVVLEAHALVSRTLRGVDLAVRAHEIVGVTGLLGSGRDELASVLFGVEKRVAGQVRVAGKLLSPGDPRACVRSRLGYVPADRRGKGAVMTLSALENITLPLLRPLRRAAGRLDRRRERQEVDRWLDEIELRPREPYRQLGLFSGGNQQKVILAKWLRSEPVALLLDEPTQGVDIGAKAAVYKLVRRAAGAGTAVLVSSADTDELMTLCDRVLVFRDGMVRAELGRAELTASRLLLESLPSGRTTGRRTDQRGDVEEVS